MNPAKVNVSTAFETIIDISESSHTLEIKFKIQLEWYEYRTKFYNMKYNAALNVLTSNEKALLWIPYIIFKNTDLNEAVTIDGADSTLFVTREGNFTRAGIDFVDETE